MVSSRYSLLKLIGVTTACASVLALASSLVVAPPLRIGISVFVVMLAAFLLFTTPQTWWKVCFATFGFVGGAIFGFVLYESPLPGAVYGLLASFVLLRQSRFASEDRIARLQAISAIILAAIAVAPYLMSLDHHRAKRAIRKARIDIDREPVWDSSESARIAGFLLGPHLVKHNTTVRLHDSAKRSGGLWYHDETLVELEREFENLRGVDALHLIDCDDVTDLGLASLAKIQGLKDVQIVDQDISSVGFEHFADQKKIEVVLLRCPNVDDQVVKVLTGYPQLRHVYLDETQVSDEATQQFAQCPKLDQITVPQSASKETVQLLRKSIRAVLKIDPKTGKYGNF